METTISPQPQRRPPPTTKAPSARAEAPVPARTSRARARDDRAARCEVKCINAQAVTRARRALPAAAVLSNLAERLRALGDRTRLQIVWALGAPGARELCVCDLASLIGVSDSAVSHSLRTLRQLGVVQYRKAGKIAYYSLANGEVGAFVRAGVRALAPSAG
ncbi:MAG: winged helix-turn-helix transcriptional regulator [Gemmatimonadetes bacterium]|nr:winged helix-turn-helix transcriptional regulator [Gemmatimonadota bacterium]